MPRFDRYVGIDYSGAKTPTSSLKGLRIFEATGFSDPAEVHPPASPRKYWTRRGVAEWLCERLSEDVSTIVGIDHGFSFPIDYFRSYAITESWSAFLEDFQRYWPTEGDKTTVESLRRREREGNPRWRRKTELKVGAAKSVFHFDVQGSVAKSTHAGIPWLIYLKNNAKRPVHFWPFDGWEIPTRQSAVVEVYPRLCNRLFSSEMLTQDQHDAYSVAAWLKLLDGNRDIERHLRPPLAKEDLDLARAEGWIFGA